MLGSAFRDKARVLPRDRQSARNAEGGYDLVTAVAGPWFRCLYDPGSESETRDQGRVRRVRPATLLFGKTATDGMPVDVRAQDRVEILSGAHGTVIMEIVGTPEVIAKRRTRIGSTANLRKVAA